MTKKDLFSIILKLYGLYSIIELITQLPNVLYFMFTDSNFDMMFSFLTIPLISLIIVYILIFKSSLIIRLLKLDKGFDNNEVVINTIDKKDKIQIALIILSIYLIVNNFSSFLSQIIFEFKRSVNSKNELNQLIDTYNPGNVDFKLMISSGLSILIGYLLLTNYKRLSNWIDNINNKNEG